jgi:glutamate formiminotransferase
VLECVVNISEGRDDRIVAKIVERAGPACVDHHSDPWHNRSVLTLLGSGVFDAALEVARATVELCDFTRHEGVHPAIGTVDVVPFVPIGSHGFGSSINLVEARAARDAFITAIGDELGLPCFAYGPERSLPEVRRGAFGILAPTNGLPTAHPTAGGCCVGARPSLVAYNIYLEAPDIRLARSVATSIRSREVKALGLIVGGSVQVSCNLVAPWLVGPAEVVDMVSALAPVHHTELIGLIPEAALRVIARSRWAELDVGPDRTIEARLPR